MLIDISFGEMAVQPETQSEWARLHTVLDELGSVVVTYSGGVDKCPQGIDIPAELEKVHAILGRRQRISRHDS
jgi:hypothetical protein